MTIERVEKIAAEFLRGDNADADIPPHLIEFALQDVSRNCEPLAFTEAVEESKTQPSAYFRQLADGADDDGTVYKRYIVVQSVEENTTELEIDEELAQAVIYFLCSYLSNKQEQYFISKALNTIAIYNSNRQV